VLEKARFIPFRQEHGAETTMKVLAFDDTAPHKSSSANSASQQFSPFTIGVGSHADAETAIALVSEAGQAIRKLETDSLDAVTRATNTTLAVKEQLDQTISRAQKAEGALQKVESEIAELSEIVEQAGDEIEKLRSQLATIERHLAETTERAEAAEKQVEDANMSIQRIVTAIRTELPIAS
jgi:predicted RNase H-like nuclease (RuvC/YqgF family)